MLFCYDFNLGSGQRNSGGSVPRTNSTVPVRRQSSAANSTNTSFFDSQASQPGGTNRLPPNRSGGTNNLPASQSGVTSSRVTRKVPDVPRGDNSRPPLTYMNHTNVNSLNNRSSGEGGSAIVCNCGTDAILLTVKKEGPNTGEKSYIDKEMFGIWGNYKKL